MAKTAEEATLATVRVGDRDIPVGPITVHQIFRLKNFIVSVILIARHERGKRESSQTDHVIEETKNEMQELRVRFAELMGIDVEKVDEVAFLQSLGETVQQKILRADQESGYAGQIGAALEVLEVMTEHQILEFATLLLDRYSYSHITFEFVEQHFTLEWFLEALSVTFETNNIPSIIKNSQRLGIALSTQMTLAKK